MFGLIPARAKHRRDRRGMWSGMVLAKYWALQLPATALVIVVLRAVGDHFAWPQWIVWTAVAVWVTKDAILYPFLWRAYYPSDPTASPYPLQGAKGVAMNPIDPSGLIRIWGEIWRAELARGARRIEQGETVRVNARHGLTLLIEPEGGGQERAGRCADRLSESYIRTH